MVGLNMNGPTRDQVLKFMEEKDKIEREIRELTAVLEANGNVGMEQPLVDAEGFPRADIDVYRVRHARHRIICLQNDHKAIMKQIEQGLHQAHSELATGEGASNAQPRGGAGSSNTPAVNGNGRCYTNGSETLHRREEERLARVVAATNNLNVEGPFVKVDLVHNGSPADIAGIRVNDEIIQFGSINTVNYVNLNQIGNLVANSAGARIDVRLRRGGNILNLTLVPQQWAGPGLLGCNVIHYSGS